MIPQHSPSSQHDTRLDRRPEITVPMLALAGVRDPGARPELGRRVAELIPGAQFDVLEEEGRRAFRGGPGRVGCARRRVLARGRGSRLSSRALSQGTRFA